MNLKVLNALLRQKGLVARAFDAESVWRITAQVIEIKTRGLFNGVFGTTVGYLEPAFSGAGSYEFSESEVFQASKRYTPRYRECVLRSLEGHNTATKQQA